MPDQSSPDPFDWQAFNAWSRWLKSYVPKVRAPRSASHPLAGSSRTATDEGRSAAPRTSLGAGSRRR